MEAGKAGGPPDQSFTVGQSETVAEGVPIGVAVVPLPVSGTPDTGAATTAEDNEAQQAQRVDGEPAAPPSDGQVPQAQGPAVHEGPAESAQDPYACIPMGAALSARAPSTTSPAPTSSSSAAPPMFPSV